MSSDQLSAFASVGTFIVIGVTAIAAVIQLRHLRSGNQAAAVQTLFASYEGAELRDAFQFVRTELADRMKDPQFRLELRRGQVDRLRHPEIKILNLFDEWGVYYRHGVIDRQVFMQVWGGIVVRFWHQLEPVIALLADPVEGNTAFQQFEYVAAQAQRWLEKHPEGDYPRGAHRMPLVDAWRDVDSGPATEP